MDNEAIRRLFEEEGGTVATPAGPNSDPKTALNTFCQRYCKKAISKTDIVYTAQKIGSEYQAVVKLNCIEGIEFAGETASNQKDAEKNSAKQALLSYSAEIQKLPPAKTNNKKRKATGEGGAGLDNPAMKNAKFELNICLMRILRRPLTKEDVQYSTVQTALGYQSTISLPSLPGEWATFAWAGEVDRQKKDAEEFAARHAVEALRADAQMANTIDNPPSKAKKPDEGGKSSGGKASGGKASGGKASAGGKACGGKACGGKGKSSWGGGGSWYGFDNYWGGGWALPAAWGMASMGMAALGWGSGPVASGPLKRERITEEPVTGAVVEWKDRYGWLTLHTPIDHPQAKKNAGKIYLNMKDWQQPEVLPTEGMTVSMHVYADQSGLGAEEVSPLDGF